jgi:2-haloacid dehalogenase
MTPVEMLRREVEVLTFDLYGTVVDMQTGLTEAVTPFLEQKGWTGEPHRFVTWWRRTHFEDSMIDSLCDRGHTPYRQIGHRAVSRVMDRAGIDYSQDEVEWLVSRIETLQPFPDAVAALEKLQARYKLVILSNGDRDMLEAARPHIGFEFDHIISVQEAGAFKPDWRTYAAAETILSEAWPRAERSAIMHVANHPFDCVGAKAYGMRAAFIDRRKQPFGETPHQPDLRVDDLAGLAGAMG